MVMTTQLAILVVSFTALAFSIASFILSYLQRGRENRDAKRKMLSDLIGELLKVDQAFVQLRIDAASFDVQAVSLRRSYNSQRRYLANHAEAIIAKNNNIASDIDCNVIARAFEVNGDYLRAEKFYKKSLDLSPSPSLKMANTRALARFNFLKGDFDEGRRLFENAVGIQLDDSDSSKSFRADTYYLWSLNEAENGFDKNEIKAKNLAIELAKGMRRADMKHELLLRLNGVHA